MFGWAAWIEPVAFVLMFVAFPIGAAIYLWQTRRRR